MKKLATSVVAWFKVSICNDTWRVKCQYLVGYD
jgi:hypothetical protein